MLKGVFHKSVAYLGIITGILGVVSETLRPIMGISYAVYGILLIVWFLVIGWNLFWLASSKSSSRMVKKLEARAAS
jgi:sulfite exporter TauE/SafE